MLDGSVVSVFKYRGVLIDQVNKLTGSSTLLRDFEAVCTCMHGKLIWICPCNYTIFFE